MRLGMKLDEWYEQYLKNRDLMHRKIASFGTKKEEDQIISFVLQYKDDSKEQVVIAEEPQSFLPLLQNQEKDKRISVVVLNKRSAIKKLIEEWDNLAEYKYLTVVFANQKSLTEKRWIVKPYIHNRITERSALETGIKTLSSTVDLC